MKKKKGMTADDFMALPDSEKNRIYEEIDRVSPEQLRAQSKPLNQRERAQWDHIRAAMKRGRGRPKLGKTGVKKVSISVEASLLTDIDVYAQAHGMKRSEVFAGGAARLINQ